MDIDRIYSQYKATQMLRGGGGGEILGPCEKLTIKYKCLASV